MVMLTSIDELLEHIGNVQLDVIALSNESLIKMSSFIENHNIEVDEDITTALQYQDIITQQLNATIEAMQNMRESINMFSNEYTNDENSVEQSIDKLCESLNATLVDAKEKKSRFSGKFAENNADEEIEFF